MRRLVPIPLLLVATFVVAVPATASSEADQLVEPATAPAGERGGSGTGAPAAGEPDAVTTPTTSSDVPPVEPPSGAAEVSVALPQRDGVRVGEPFPIRVDVRLPEGGQLVSVNPAGNRFVEVLDREAVQRDSRVASTSMRLVVYRAGRHDVTAIEAVWIDATGRQRVDRGQPFTIHVRSVIANEQDPQLAPPGDFEDVRTVNRVLFWVSIGLTVGLAFGLLAALVWARRRGDDVVAPEAPPCPPHEVALEELDELEQTTWLEDGEHLVWHARLSEVLRAWLEGRLGFGATEMTTSEIRAVLSSRGLEIGPWFDDILDVLQQTDAVKFARVSMDTRSSLELLAMVRTVVSEVWEQEQAGEPDVPPPLAVDDAGTDPVASAPQPTDPLRAPVGERALPVADNVVVLGRKAESPDPEGRGPGGEP